MPFYKEANDSIFVSLDNGVSGLNYEAIAKLSAVTEGSIRKLLKKTLVQESSFICLKKFYLNNETDLIIDTYKNQKLLRADIAYALIAYYANLDEPYRKKEAVESITAIGAIGMTAYIQTVTGFHQHQGNDQELNILHSRLELLEAVRLRHELLLKNNESFALNISNKLEALVGAGVTVKDYLADLSVLPPQNQRDFFKAYRVIIDTLWFIHTRRKDLRTTSILNLSKDMIKNMMDNAPTEMLVKSSLSGTGKTYHDPEWSNLFSTSIEYVVDDRRIGKEVPGEPGDWGKSKEVQKLTNKKQADNADVEREEELHRIATLFTDNYKNFSPKEIHDHFKANSQICFAKQRINTIVPGLYQRLLEIKKGYEYSKSFLSHVDLPSSKVLNSSIDMKTRLSDVYFILEALERHRNVNNPDCLLLLFPEFKNPVRRDRECYLLPEVYDCLARWKSIRDEMYKATGLYGRSNDEILRILKWARYDTRKRYKLENSHKLPAVFDYVYQDYTW